MKKTLLEKLVIVFVVLAVAALCMAERTRAVEYNLRADVATKTMPDGTVITMWGFADDGLGEGTGAVTVPGPVLTVPAGDTTLTIQLKNNLTADKTGAAMESPSSIVIPGQYTQMTPVRFGAAPYPEFEGRVRSLTQETPPGGTGTYTWTNMKPGTYIYHSGSHLQCQVQMGLYGGVRVYSSDGKAYPGLIYDKEVILLYSEIDPAFHAAVSAGQYGPGKTLTSAINYKPQYFLINGAPYPEAEPIANGEIYPNDRVLIRFLNAGLKTHAPTCYNLYSMLIAEDGNLLPYPLDQYSVLLPALQTKDVVTSPYKTGNFPIYDRTLHLTNAKEPGGGMFTYLPVINRPSDGGGTGGDDDGGGGGTGTITGEPQITIIGWNQATSTFVIGNSLLFGTLSWSIGTHCCMEGVGWIKSIEPTSGTATYGSPSIVTVTVDASGLLPGTYTAVIPITSNGGDTSVTIYYEVLLKDQPLPTICDENADCVDGLFCSGVETCDNNTCLVGADPCGEDQVCLESLDECRDVISLTAEIRKMGVLAPRIRDSRCLLLRIRPDETFVFDNESDITISGPEEGDAGVIVDPRKEAVLVDVLSLLLGEHIFVPICIERGAPAGQWTITIESETEIDGIGVLQQMEATFMIR